MMLAAYYHTILALVFAVVAILLMIVILLQRGKGVGLAGAFGGTGGHTAFGAKTGDFLTWVTVIGAGVLLVFAILLNFVFVRGKPVLAPVASPPGPVAPTGGGVPGDAGGLAPVAPGTGPAYARLAVFGEAAG